METYSSIVIVASVLLAKCTGESPEQGNYDTITESNATNVDTDKREDKKNLAVIIGSVVAAVVVIAIIVTVVIVCYVRRRNKRRHEKRERELKDYLDRDWIRPPCETSHQETKPFILSSFYSHDSTDNQDQDL